MEIRYSDLVTEFGFDMWPERDRPGGKIGSAMPAWYFDTHLSEELTALRDQEAMIERGGVAQENLHRMKNQCATERFKLDAIKASFPKPRAGDKDKLANIVTQLGACIKDSMFTRSEMESGRVQPHEELRRSKDPVVPIPRQVARWVIYCNGRVYDDNGTFKSKRDDLVRSWKIGRRILGVSSWTDDLRPREHPEGARTGDYKQIFTGFDEKKIEEVGMQEPEPQLAQTELPDESGEKGCVGCGCSMDGESHLAKWCMDCREARKKEKESRGRKNAHKNAGRGT